MFFLRTCWLNRQMLHRIYIIIIYVETTTPPVSTWFCVSEVLLFAGWRKKSNKWTWQTVKEHVNSRKKAFHLYVFVCVSENNSQTVLILQLNILYVSSLRGKPVGFITVFLKVQSMAQSQDRPFCWAVLLFLSWHKTTDEKYSQPSKKPSEADRKANVFPENTLIKQTQVTQNTVNMVLYYTDWFKDEIFMWPWLYAYGDQGYRICTKLVN